MGFDLLSNSDFSNFDVLGFRNLTGFQRDRIIEYCNNKVLPLPNVERAAAFQECNNYLKTSIESMGSIDTSHKFSWEKKPFNWNKAGETAGGVFDFIQGFWGTQQQQDPDSSSGGINYTWDYGVKNDGKNTTVLLVVLGVLVVAGVTGYVIYKKSNP